MASIVVNGDTSGSVTLSAPAVAGSVVLTLPSASGTISTSSSQWTTSGSDIFYNTGNVSIGTAPPAWSGFKVLDIGSQSSLWSIGTGNGTSYYSNNLYYNGSARIYKTTGGASEYTQSTGSHQFYIAASGTAGNSVSLTEVGRFNQYGFFKAANNAYNNANGQYHEIKSDKDDFILYMTNASTNTPYGMDITFSGASPNNATRIFYYAEDNVAQRFAVRSNGGIANYQANDANLSDRREKTNFAPAKSYLNTICSIPVQTFNYIDQNLEEDDGLTLGVVAQDVQLVAPELVMESNWARKGEEPKMRLSIYQTDLQYALMKSIQELKTELDTVKAELAALRG